MALERIVSLLQEMLQEMQDKLAQATTVASTLLEAERYPPCVDESKSIGCTLCGAPLSFYEVCTCFDKEKPDGK